MTDFKPIKRIYEMMAVAADHWPVGHGSHWGKTIHGYWTGQQDRVAEFG